MVIGGGDRLRVVRWFLVVVVVVVIWGVGQDYCNGWATMQHNHNRRVRVVGSE